MATKTVSQNPFLDAYTLRINTNAYYPQIKKDGLVICIPPK